VVRDPPRNPLEESEAEYQRKKEERRIRKEEREKEMERELKRKEKAKWDKAMNAPVPESVRMTKATVLKVESVRTAQLLEEQQKKREKAKSIARQRRAKEAGEDLRPFLIPRQHNEAQQTAAFEQERELPARVKAKQAKAALEEKVKAKRPTLMERHDMLTAQDKARASTLRKVGGALRTAYGGGDGWLTAAMRDNVLDADEVEFLRLANPSAADNGPVGDYDDDDDEY
jgi:hypothetical protein